MDVGLTLRKSMVGGRREQQSGYWSTCPSQTGVLEDRFKFVDDLSILEIVNLLTV